MNPRKLAAAAVAAGGALAAWGAFEAQWIERRVVDVPVAGLDPALDGLSILHLSDLHAGSPSFNLRTLRKAVVFGVETQPDMVVITGDIVAHPRARRAVIEQLARLSPPLGSYASLGNHDIGRTRDPFSRGMVLEDWEEAPVQLLRDTSATVELSGVRIEIAGMEPQPWIDGIARPWELFRSNARLRILLAHFPDAIDDLPPGSADLVLAGHLHGGQICLPGPRGRVRLSHTEFTYLDGTHRVGDTTLVVSRGTGTTLVPFRLVARPEIALLRLHPA